jgi:hypothetical protein
MVVSGEIKEQVVFKFTVEGKPPMLGQDWTSRKRIGHFRHGQQRVVEKGEEQGTTLQEESARCIRRIVEQRTGNERLDQCGDLLDHESSLVAPDDLKSCQQPVGKSGTQILPDTVE